jgi:hypothetical protein
LAGAVLRTVKEFRSLWEAGIVDLLKDLRATMSIDSPEQKHLCAYLDALREILVLETGYIDNDEQLLACVDMLPFVCDLVAAHFDKRDPGASQEPLPFAAAFVGLTTYGRVHPGYRIDLDGTKVDGKVPCLCGGRSGPKRRDGTCPPCKAGKHPHVRMADCGVHGPGAIRTWANRNPCANWESSSTKTWTSTLASAPSLRIPGFPDCASCEVGIEAKNFRESLVRKRCWRLRSC